jgi:4-cresol dehydrogenase (hydroxylating)
MSRRVPLGSTAADLDAAIAAFVGELGDVAVVTDGDALLEFRDPYTYRESDEFDASAMVMPTSTEQVQAVVRIANEHGVPLWTFSQGRNNTYGGPAPRLRGCVLVNLRAMNRVLEIEQELAYAVVEPGVRWFDLFDALQDAGGGLWPSIPDLGWGSVVGNSLEYGIGYMPHGDHASHVCGMEVVLPDGSLLRTGMGAISGAKAWHVYPHGFGPSVEGLFKQSSLGIVTRLGVWLMPRPECYASCWVRVSGYEQLAEVVDVLRSLMLDRIVENHPMITRGLEVDADGNPYLDPMSETWHGRFALYGSADLIDAYHRVVEARLAHIDGAEVGRRNFDGDDGDGPSNHDERVQRGIPDMDFLDERLLPYGPRTGHLDFSPVGRCLGREVVELQKLVRSLYEKAGHPHVGGICLAPRSALCITTTFYDTTNQAQTERVYAAYSEMVREVARHGYVPYRTNLQNMDVVADQLDFGDHALRRLHEAIKDALDPKGVMAPGKQGVWPAGRRDR